VIETCFTIVDLESTGLLSKVHRMTELAAIRIKVVHEGGISNCSIEKWFWVLIDEESISMRESPYLQSSPATPAAMILGGHIRPLVPQITARSFAGGLRVPEGSRYHLLADHKSISMTNYHAKRLMIVPTCGYFVAWNSLFDIVGGSHWVGSNPSFDLSFFDEYLKCMYSERPRLASHKLIDPTSAAVPELISGATKSLSQANVGKALNLGDEPHTAFGDAYQLLQIFCDLYNITPPDDSEFDLLKEMPTT
jgi:hypothetical protein